MRMLRIITVFSLIIELLALSPLLANASEPVKVAILDSGSNIIFKEGISLIDSTVRDYNGHGTLMAEIIKEISPDAELYIVKVIGENGLAVNEEAVILGIQWAISRDVDVINVPLSLKGSLKLHQVIKLAHEKGIVIIAAAGNKASGHEIAYPAGYKEVIAVGALNRYGRVHKDSIKGEVYIRGYKGRKAGTSIASAYATGLVAKIISENPNSNAREMKNIIIRKLRVNDS